MTKWDNQLVESRIILIIIMVSCERSVINELVGYVIVTMIDYKW